jgi:hypothetical protein
MVFERQSTALPGEFTSIRINMQNSNIISIPGVSRVVGEPARVLRNWCWERGDFLNLVPFSAI